MLPVLLPIVLIVAVALIVSNKNKSNPADKSTPSTFEHKEAVDATRADASASHRPAKAPQSKVDSDRELLKKIVIFGGIGCVIVAIIICIALYKTKDPDAVGIGFIAVLAVIAIGSLSSKKKNNKKVKSYFVDEMRRIHSPGDLDFERELIRYSEYNESYYHKPISASDRDSYIIDGKGNKVDIRSKRFWMCDSQNEVCYIKMI